MKRNLVTSDAAAEQFPKLTSPRINIQQNAALLNNPSLIYPTLYASPLITLTKHGYTNVAEVEGRASLLALPRRSNVTSRKHYFEEGHRICSKIGGGFRNVRIEEVDEHVPELKFDYGEQHHRQKDGVGQTFNACLRVDPQIDRGVDLYKMLVVQEYIRDEQEPAFYYHSDHLGSSAYLTDEAGAVTQTLNYLPYGEDWVDVQNYVDTRYPRLGIYGFNAKEKDYESGYHYYGARYYDSELLTGWLSVDPMADKYPNISPYHYCHWDPIILTDPNGMYDTKRSAQLARKRAAAFGKECVGDVNRGADGSGDYRFAVFLPGQRFGMPTRKEATDMAVAYGPIGVVSSNKELRKLKKDYHQTLGDKIARFEYGIQGNEDACNAGRITEQDVTVGIGVVGIITGTGAVAEAPGIFVGSLDALGTLSSIDDAFTNSEGASGLQQLGVTNEHLSQAKSIITTTSLAVALFGNKHPNDIVSVASLIRTEIMHHSNKHE